MVMKRMVASAAATVVLASAGVVIPATSASAACIDGAVCVWEHSNRSGLRAQLPGVAAYDYKYIGYAGAPTFRTINDTVSSFEYQNSYGSRMDFYKHAGYGEWLDCINNGLWRNTKSSSNDQISSHRQAAGRVPGCF